MVRWNSHSSSTGPAFSGCGCSAVTLSAYLLDLMEHGNVRRMLFLATGALLSPGSSMQGESIPGIAHGVVREREDLL